MNGNKNGKKVIGVAIVAIIVASISAIIAPASIGQPSPPAGGAIYYLVPDNSSGSPGSPVVVQLRVNSSVRFSGGDVTITYDPSCVNITGFTYDPEWEDKLDTWGPGVYRVHFGNKPGGVPTNLTAGDYLIGNFTVECVSSCCATNLTFNFSACPSPPYCVDLYDSPGGVAHITPLETDNGTFICGMPLTVDKKIYNPDTGTWNDTLDNAVPNVEYTFRIEVTAGCLNLTNVNVVDTLTGVMDINCSTVSPSYTSCGPKTIQWNFGTLNASETKTLYFNASATDYGMSEDKVTATGTCKKLGVPVPQAEDTLIVKTPVPYLALMYLKPQNSSAPFCNTTKVEIWVNSSVPFQSGQINLTYDPNCADVVNWERNEALFPHGSWDSSKPGEEWILFARNDEIIGDYMIGTLTIHCNNTCDCNTTLDIVDYSEVAPSVRYSTVYDADSVIVKTMGEDGRFNCTNPDLIVTAIKLNPDAKGLKDNAAGPTNHTGAKRQCNNISATIENIGNGAAGPFYVRFNVSHEGGPEEMLCEVLVNGLNASESKTVDCKCKWYPFAYENYTIIVTADSLDNVTECNESNNVRTRDVVPGVLGYKGNSWQDGRNLTTKIKMQGHINLRYSAGNSTYLGASSYPNWTEYAVKWVPENLSIPNAADVKEARLYVYYTFGRITGDYYTPVYPEFNLTFNGKNYTMNDLIGNYTDRPAYGFNVFYNFPSGMLVYNVTDVFKAYDDNLAVLHNLREPSNEEVSIQGMVLMVIYEHENEPERVIYVDEGFDMIYARKYYGVTNEEATAYAIFNVTEDIGQFGNARLITIAPDASQKQGAHAVSFNGVKWVGTEGNPIFQPLRGGLYVDERSVKTLLKQGENIADYQSVITPWGRYSDAGDYFEVSNAILILEKGKKKVVELVPDDVIVQPQEQFEMDVVVDPYTPILNGVMVDVFAVQYVIKYDPNVLRAETVVLGDFLSQDGNESKIVYYNNDQASGTIEFGATRVGTDTGVTYRGVLSTIQFTAIGEPGDNTTVNITEVVLVDSDKQVNTWYEVHNATVTIYKNNPPVAVAASKHRVNNAAKKYQCYVTLCACKSYDPDQIKGGNISYIRWAFGDGQYGTSEGIENCMKRHQYETWKWVGGPDGHYEPFVAILTVTDDGCPTLSNSTTLNVTVYIAGDANGDGVVNIVDAAYVGKHWHERCNQTACECKCCDPCWDDLQADEADLNNDCYIDIMDLAIIGANWKHTAW